MPRVPRAASEPTYGQALRHNSGRKRNKCHPCLTNVTQALWEAFPDQSWCWGARLPQPSGTHCLLPLSQSSPLFSCLPSEGPRGSLPMAMSRRGWQGVGSLGKVPGVEAHGQMPGALSCSIPGCCTHSCRETPGCKPHHMHLLQWEIKLYM